MTRLQKKFLFQGMVAAVLVVTAWASSALPINTEATITYYSDSAHTKIVGGRSFGDCFPAYAWGQISPYSSESITTCAPPGGLGPPIPPQDSNSGGPATNASGVSSAGVVRPLQSDGVCPDGEVVEYFYNPTTHTEGWRCVSL